MSADRATTALRRLAPAALALSLGACDWFTDFKDQPRIEPWESYALRDSTGRIDTLAARKLPFRGQPMYSVPVTGTAVSALAVSYTPGIAQLDSIAAILTSNPVPADERSLENGRRHYQINCAVCHGSTGDGRGPVTLYGLPVPSLITPQAQGYSDGYLWGIIRNGRGLMPTYNRIEEPDRWDVVNYMRGLQGRYAVQTTPAGAPGEGGRAVPGYTQMAPTRPAPYAPAARGTADTASARGAPVEPADVGLPGTGNTGVSPAAGGTTGGPPGTTPAVQPNARQGAPARTDTARPPVARPPASQTPAAPSGGRN